MKKISFDYNSDDEKFAVNRLHELLTWPDKKSSYFRGFFNLVLNIYKKWQKNNQDADNRPIPIDFKKFKKLNGHPENTSEVKGKICTIYSTYSKDGIIPDRAVYALKEYSKVSDYIIVVGDYDLKSDAEYAKISEIANCACYVRHGQYDIGSWDRALKFLEKKEQLAKFDYLILTNDSNYGPIYPLKDVYSRMNRGNSDFWGITDNFEPTKHLQSYFLALKKNVFTSDLFKNIFKYIPPQVTFDIAVNQYELKLTQTLSEKFTYRALVHDMCCGNVRSSIAGNGNPTLWPVDLLKAGSPFIKCKAMNGSYGNDLYQSEIDVLEYVSRKNSETADIILKENPNLRSKSFDSSKDGCNPESISKLLDGIDIVSFDIFDTLLIRPFISPTDLFDYIGKKYGVAEFRKKRVDAELKSRFKVPSMEVTIDEIYSEMDEDLQYLKNIEIELELELIAPNPVVSHYFDEAIKHSKRIICVSDTYFKRDHIIRMLEKCGYSGIEKIFLSSESKTNKGNELFNRVIDAIGIDPSKMLHIGDNRSSDYDMPIKKGMNSLLINRISDLFLKMPANIKYASFEMADRGLISSAYVANLSKYRLEVSKNYSFWYDFGYCLGGPFACGFLRHIQKCVDNYHLDGLFFASRDGFFLKKLFDRYYSNERTIETRYVYLSRQVGLVSTLDYEDEPSYIKKLLSLASKQYPDISVSDNYSENVRTYNYHLAQLKEWSQEYHDAFVKHLTKESGNMRRIAVVDMTTAKMSAYHYAKLVLGDRVVLGINSASFNENYSIPHSYFLNEKLEPKYTPEVMLSEQIITSQELPIKYLGKDLKPVYEKRDINDVQTIIDIQAGIEAFVKNNLIIFKHDDEILFTMKDWLLLLNTYLKFCNKTDILYLDQLNHSSSVDGVSDCLNIGNYVRKMQNIDD